jgi:sugar transferase EpsL
MADPRSRRAYRLCKRCLDLFASGSALVLLAPVMAVVAIAVRWRLGGPVIFRQDRPGLEGKIFSCLKFRTMTNATDRTGALLPDDQRMTPFGRFLRRSSLDELPQLWSVFVGDMSLVGPRPLMVRYLPRYSAEQARRHLVKPGITGWAQVNGRNTIDWDRKLALDVWYVDHCSIPLDLKILAKTVSKVLAADGISREGQVSMEEFMGTQPQSQDLVFQSSSSAEFDTQNLR